MKSFALCVVALCLATVVSFVCGFVFGSLVPFDVGRDEPRAHKYEVLKQEAAGFFYDTMRELFEGTYDPQEGHVSTEALDTFNKYKSQLDPRCWFVNMYMQYSDFYGEVLFSSGDVFEVRLSKGIRRTDPAWILDDLNYWGTKGTEYFYHDLRRPAKGSK